MESKSYTSLDQIYSLQLAPRTKAQGKEGTEIPGMQLNIDVIQTTTNILECMTVWDLKQATPQDEHLQ